MRKRSTKHNYIRSLIFLESTAKPVTPPAKASGKLQSTNPTTVQATSVKSVIHSTSSIKRQYSKGMSTKYLC